MAKLSTEDILKLARLARLELTDEEIESFRDEISNILGYVEQLQQVDLNGLEPTSQVTGLTNVTRPDQTYEYGADSTALLMNSPATEAGHIKVRRML